MTIIHSNTSRMQNILTKVSLSLLCLLYLSSNAVALDFDVGPVSVDHPTSGVLTSTEFIVVTVENFTNKSIAGTEYSIRYSVNGGLQLNTIGVAVPPNSTAQVILPMPFDMAIPGDYDIDVQTFVSGDINTANDVLPTVTVVSQVGTESPPDGMNTEISIFPHAEDFEGSSANDWKTKADFGSTEFELGDPLKAWIVGAASGNNAWVTSLTDFYTGSRSQVFSPLFDLRDIPAAEITLNVFWETLAGQDGARLEYSDDDASWEIVGAAGDPNNWYNNTTVTAFDSTDQAGWSGYRTAGTASFDADGWNTYRTSGETFSTPYGAAVGTDVVGSAGYVLARNILQGGEKTRLRIIFVSDVLAGLTGDEGFAFDDFTIKAAATLPSTATLLTDVNNNGAADIGDVVRISSTFNNLSENISFTNATFTDTVTSPSLTLEAGSVTSSAGTVTSGNTAGDTTVSVNIGTLGTETSVTITYDLVVSAFGADDDTICTQGTVVTDQFNGSTNDPGTDEPGDASCVSTVGVEASLAYNTSTFNESTETPGTISNNVIGTLTNETFVVSNGVMTAGTHYTATNVPAGLTLKVTGISSTSVRLELNGTANVHETDVSNLTISFKDAAFTLAPASFISGSSKNDFLVNYGFTAPPAPKKRQVGGTVTVDGKPAANANVFVVGVGSTRTDENGYFLLGGADRGESYNVIVSKAGVTFESGLKVKSGETVDVSGSDDEEAPDSCSERNVSARLDKIGDLATAIFNKGSRILDNKLNLSSGRILSNLQGFLVASADYPSVVLSCPDDSGCTPSGLGAKKKTMNKRLKRLRGKALAATRAARDARQISDAAFERTRRSIRSKFAAAKRRIDNLPKRTFSC